MSLSFFSLDDLLGCQTLVLSLPCSRETHLLTKIRQYQGEFNPGVFFFKKKLRAAFRVVCNLVPRPRPFLAPFPFWYFRPLTLKASKTHTCWYVHRYCIRVYLSSHKSCIVAATRRECLFLFPDNALPTSGQLGISKSVEEALVSLRLFSE